MAGRNGSQSPESAQSRQIGNCTVRVIQDDITDLAVEAFVYYARPNLALGSGFGNAIAKRGGPSIKAELEKIGSVPVTEAVVTSAGKLKAKFIVHAAGPSFQEEQLEARLEQTVANALKRAEEKGIRQIALPAMGAGFFGIPLAACAEVMLRAIREYLGRGGGLREVVLCANDRRELESFKARLAGLN